jgi:hypothetical protein
MATSLSDPLRDQVALEDLRIAPGLVRNRSVQKMAPLVQVMTSGFRPHSGLDEEP